MRFLTNKVQPELVTSKDAHRTALTKVHLNAEKSQVEVTDSYMLARFPVELDEGDTSGPIPLDALKASRKPMLKHVAQSHGTSIRCNSHVEVRHAFGEDASEPYLTMARDEAEYTFPNVDQLVPENLAKFRIGLNADKLSKLAKAMGCGPNDGVELRFAQGLDGNPSSLRPILVRPISKGDGSPDGLLMPIRLPIRLPA